jgi:CheY-like chemotaxis protein
VIDEHAKPGGGATAERRDAATGRGASLLVVDDSRRVLELVSEGFTSRGYLVYQAASAEDALVLLDEIRPDAIVADVLMPGMDGWAFFEAVKKRDRMAEVPFVFLTTEAELRKRLRGLSIGADDYLTKPCDIEELHARIERLILRRREIDRMRDEEGALLAGSIEHLAMPDLLQVLSLNRTDGVLAMASPPDEGTIVLDHGRIVHAECDGAIGIKALYRMLGWPAASFRLIPREASAPDEEHTIDTPTANLVMDGLVSLDEWHRRQPELPAADSRIEVDARVGSGSDARELDAIERELLDLIGEGSTVDDILNRSPRTDAEIAAALCGCLERGVLRAGE